MEEIERYKSRNRHIICEKIKEIIKELNCL